MSQYKTPAEAIAACDAECEVSWQAFAKGNGIEEVIDPIAYGVAKMVFRAGYMNGARYVSGFIVSNLAKHAKENPAAAPTT